ncbi:DUF6651 domain-containing protein [Cobetia sp. SIMBA_158]|uniref:DUF6651 domain-containing protein n=1 Tax=Cobetia sp. SIMBA_158 TaxID=3081617 RepID=UPI00397F9CC6
MPWFMKFLNNSLMDAATSEGSAGGTAGSQEAPEGKPAIGDSAENGGAGDDKSGEKAEDKSEADKPTDREAQLLKEVMAKKQLAKDLEAKLKAFGDVTPERIQSLITAEQERQAQEAEREKQDMEKRGEWDRLKETIVGEHQKVLGEKDNQISELLEKQSALSKQIEDMTIGSDFSNSQFITNELLLTPSKARVVYGSHFEVKDGQVVAYDKPAGAKDRTMLVDGRGEALNFDAAIKKLVDADPERDSLIRAKAKPGVGSNKPEAGAPSKSVAAGVSRISAGLASTLSK